MKIKLTQSLKNIDGKELHKEIVENGKVVELKALFQLKDVCVNALMTNTEEKIEGQEKMRRYLLATKIQKANELDLKSEEIVLLKKVIGEMYGVLVVGQSFEMLEQ